METWKTDQMTFFREMTFSANPRLLFACASGLYGRTRYPLGSGTQAPPIE